jgi:hypothetical protein
MEKKKLQALLRDTLSGHLARLSRQAEVLRADAEQINCRVTGLQHGIARLAYHSRVNPFAEPTIASRARQVPPERGEGRKVIRQLRVGSAIAKFLLFIA